MCRVSYSASVEVDLLGTTHLYIGAYLLYMFGAGSTVVSARCSLLSVEVFYQKHLSYRLYIQY